MGSAETTARRARFEAAYAAARDPLVRYFARRADADRVEDLFAETMVVAWRRLADIPCGAEVPWLLGVARRILANQRRSDGRLARLRERLRLSTPAERARTEPAGLDRDPRLTEALGTLAAGDVEILRLSAWDELPPREIAVVLGIGVNAATVRLHRARARLRAALERADAAVGKEGGGAGHEFDVRHTQTTTEATR